LLKDDFLEHKDTQKSAKSCKIQ